MTGTRKGVKGVGEGLLPLKIIPSESYSPPCIISQGCYTIPRRERTAFPANEKKRPGNRVGGVPLDKNYKDML